MHRTDLRDRAFQRHRRPQTHVAALRDRRLPVHRDTGAHHVERQIRPGQRRRRIAQVHNVVRDTRTPGRGGHLGQATGLLVVERMIRHVAVREVRHQAAHRHRTVAQGARQRGQDVRVFVRADAVATQTGVCFDGHHRGAAGACRGVEQVVHLPQGRHRDLDVGLQRGREVGAGRMQPAQDRRGDPVPAQCERLVDRDDPESGGSRGQRGPGHRGGAVAVTVGLDHGHHRGRTHAVAHHTHVVGDGVEVDHRAGCVHEPVLGSGHRPRLSQAHVQWAKCSSSANPPMPTFSSLPSTSTRSSRSARARLAEKPSRTTMRSTETSVASSGIV